MSVTSLGVLGMCVSHQSGGAGNVFIVANNLLDSVTGLSEILHIQDQPWCHDSEHILFCDAVHQDSGRASPLVTNHNPKENN